MSGSNNITTAFVDLATFDELEKYLYGGLRAVAYFVRCVKKSTWFSMIPVTLRATSGQRDFGSEFSVNITRAGDYLISAWLRVTVGAVNGDGPAFAQNTGAPVALGATSGNLRWTRNFMHNLIRETWVTFNDLTAMKFDNHWLDFWAAFSIPESKLNGYNNMIGNFDEMTNPQAITSLVNISATQILALRPPRGNNAVGVATAAATLVPGATADFLPQQTLNLPLPYFFALDSGVALPTAAIPYNDMKLNFDLRDWSDLLIVDVGGSPQVQLNPLAGPVLAGTSARCATAADVDGGSVSLSNVQVWANYAIVSNEERVKMGKCPRDIVIQQVQCVQRRDFDATAGSTNQYDLRLSHAVKALFWAVRNRKVACEWSNYTDAEPVYGPGAQAPVIFNQGADPVLDHSLVYENTTRLDQMGSDYFSLIQPWYHAGRIPTDTGYHMYSYALDVLSNDPMGSTNYGKLTNVSLCLTPTGSAALDNGTFDAVIRALNFNVIRISGGALGGFAKNRWLPNFVNLDKQCYHLVMIVMIYIFALNFITLNFMARWLKSGEPLRALTTTCRMETFCNTQGNDLGHSNNVKDWAIRG